MSKNTYPNLLPNHSIMPLLESVEKNADVTAKREYHENTREEGLSIIKTQKRGFATWATFTVLVSCAAFVLVWKFPEMISQMGVWGYVVTGCAIAFQVAGAALMAESVLSLRKNLNALETREPQLSQTPGHEACVRFSQLSQNAGIPEKWERDVALAHEIVTEALNNNRSKRSVEGWHQLEAINAVSEFLYEARNGNRKIRGEEKAKLVEIITQDLFSDDKDDLKFNGKEFTIADTSSEKNFTPYEYFKAKLGTLSLDENEKQSVSLSVLDTGKLIASSRNPSSSSSAITSSISRSSSFVENLQNEGDIEMGIYPTY
ncbi:MAG: hypothetical protein K0R63_846 [Rickettsiales bacterium]|jgi:hypothetical protein|nr:hypothetical protein [Rickettsiales bacterium]